ncbi:hypothetical protein F4780DRAFT_232093 [Xylariomycetidae sp. FL0641]|nr:hypothetical protein F4780DRAFT_232093 [Xylariomycetidae sp. FL0641]
MGWLWSSAPAPKHPSASAEDQGSKPLNSAKPAEPEYSDPEIAKFMAQIQAEFGGNSNSNNSGTAPDSKPSASSSAPHASSSVPTSSVASLFWSSRPAQNGSPTSASSESAEHVRLDELSESLLPTEMSCRQAFDHAFHCNSLGGQFVSVYRTGGLRDCKEAWEDFWFCMRARAYHGPMKEEAIRTHYRAKELAKYGPGRPSSTDVWEPRAERLPPDQAAFDKRVEMPEMTDEQWRQMMMLRRQMVQEKLRQQEEEAARRSG